MLKLRFLKIRKWLPLIDSMSEEELRFIEDFRELLPGYYYELNANKQARLQYNDAISSLSGDSALFCLRRNTHRLEKGLIMQPRRPVFAKDYIEETVSIYRSLLENPANGNTPSSVLKWSHDVLAEYFQATGSDPVIDTARADFQALPPPPELTPLPGRTRNPQYKPYRRLPTGEIPSYEQLLNLAEMRRSVRWFQQRKVERALIDKAVDLARLSPSACNRQPFEFRFYDDEHLVSAVASAPGGTAGFSHNFPCICVVVGKLRAFPEIRDRHVIYIDASLASMSLMFAFETLGIATCSINWPEVPQREEHLKNLLSLADDERVIMLMAAGYPDEDAQVPYSEKLPVEQLRSFNAKGSGSGQSR